MGTSRVQPRVAVHLTGRTSAELIHTAQDCEAAGIESLWTSELYTNPYVSLAAVSGATSRIQLGTGIALAFVRSPMSLALAALDMDALTEGRFILGLGTGVRTLNERWHGVGDFGSPVAHMREVIAFVREFIEHAHEEAPIRTRGEFVNVDLTGYRRPWAPQRPRIPIYLGASRPKMLALAGEVADGVIGHLFWSPTQFRKQVLPPLNRGLAVSGRERSALTVSVGVTCAIDKDESRARRAAAGPLAFYATVKTYQPIFEADGFAFEVAQIREAFLGGNKGRAVDLVTNAMIDTYCAVGSVDRVIAHLLRWEDEVDVLGLTPPRHFCSDDQIADYQRNIIELSASLNASGHSSGQL